MTMQDIPAFSVTFSVTVPGLPAACPECGHEPGQWPLRYYANEVIVVCPHCHVTAGRVVAVPGDEAR